MPLTSRITAFEDEQFPLLHLQSFAQHDFESAFWSAVGFASPASAFAW
jgi:hypothetical protein